MLYVHDANRNVRLSIPCHPAPASAVATRSWLGNYRFLRRCNTFKGTRVLEEDLALLATYSSHGPATAILKSR